MGEQETEEDEEDAPDDAGDDVGSIAALDEDLQQSERYIDTEMGVPSDDSRNDPSNT